MAGPEDRAVTANQAGLNPGHSAGGPETLARLTYTADYYNRYPGETVRLFIRVTLQQAVLAPTLRISLPEGLWLDHRQSSAGQNGWRPFIEVAEPGQFLVWPLGELTPGHSYELQLTAKVAPSQADAELESQATLTGQVEGLIAEAYVTIMVLARGNYLQYLPALYEQDELMGRLLMFCESFWAPLEEQIGNIHYYIDPGLAPLNLLPWLAGWLDLELDETWPEARRRELLKWAIKLHRRRGTKWGLQKYLEIYTGQQAEIIEHRFKDFVLDDEEARLDYGIALGPGNLPHTFTINLQLPALPVGDALEQARHEKLCRRTIEAIIEMQKPAHTVYTLNLEFLTPAEKTELT